MRHGDRWGGGAGGGQVVLLFAGGGHDPDHFPEPDHLDVTRAQCGRSPRFGKGVHFCLGAPLARLELTIVLELLAEMAPGMRLVEKQDYPYLPNVLFRSIERLLVRTLSDRFRLAVTVEEGNHRLVEQVVAITGDHVTGSLDIDELGARHQVEEPLGSIRAQ